MTTKTKRNLRPYNPSDEIIRPRDLPAVTGLSKTTCWRLLLAGDFPKKIKLSAGRTGYKKTEIMAWLESRQTVED